MNNIENYKLKNLKSKINKCLDKLESLHLQWI